MFCVYETSKNIQMVILIILVFPLLNLNQITYIYKISTMFHVYETSKNIQMIILAILVVPLLNLN